MIQRLRFRRFKANLKRRSDARDGLTSKRLMDLPEDARAILLSSIAFIFRDEVDEWSQIDFGNETHVEMLQVSVASSLAKPPTHRAGLSMKRWMSSLGCGISIRRQRAKRRPPVRITMASLTAILRS